MDFDDDTTLELPPVDMPPRGLLHRLLGRLSPALAAWWEGRQLRALQRGVTVAIPWTAIRRPTPAERAASIQEKARNWLLHHPGESGSGIAYAAPELIEEVVRDLDTARAVGDLDETVEHYREFGPKWAASLAYGYRHVHEQLSGVHACRT